MRHLLHVRNVQGIDTRTKPDNYTVNSVKSTLKQRRRVPNGNQIVKVRLKKHSYRRSYMSVRTLDKSADENLILLFLNQNICCGDSKELSQ